MEQLRIQLKIEAIALISREIAQCVYFQGERGWKENRGVQRPMIQKRSTQTIF